MPSLNPLADVVALALALGVIFLAAAAVAWIADGPLARLDERRERERERERRLAAIAEGWPTDVGPVVRHLPFDVERHA